MYTEKANKLRSILDVAAEQGVRLYLKGSISSAQDIVNCALKDNIVIKNIVRNLTGEIKEIWYA